MKLYKYYVKKGIMQEKVLEAKDFRKGNKWYINCKEDYGMLPVIDFNGGLIRGFEFYSFTRVDSNEFEKYMRYVLNLKKGKNKQ